MNRLDRKKFFSRIKLVHYINGGCLSKKDKILHLIHSSIPFALNAKKITGAFTAATGFEKDKTFSSRTINVEMYRGTNRYVLQMMDYLNRYVHDDLFGAYVLGSLGTYEEIAYSDFDALVIIKNKVLENGGRLSSLAKKLAGARKFMYKMDPFQHHGWFVLAERDLADYPPTYFPPVLFKYAKSLLPGKGSTFGLCFDPGGHDYEMPFLNLAMSIKYELEIEDYPVNMYQLKGLLSRFLLLPALYCQARDGKGIFKRSSFAEARKDFPGPLWSIMDEVSGIRLDWHCPLNPVQKFFMSWKSPFLVQIKRKIAPPIPAELNKKLSPDFYRRILDLTDLMEEKVVFLP